MEKYLFLHLENDQEYKFYNILLMFYNILTNIDVSWEWIINLKGG